MRLARITIVGAALALLLVAANVVLGIATGLGWLGVRAHALIAIPSTVLALAGSSFVVLYFLAVLGYAREQARDKVRLAALPGDARRIARGVLPWTLGAVLTLIAAYVIGGGADSGAVPPIVHLGLALLALFVHIVSAYRTILAVGLSLELEEKAEPARVPAGSGAKA